MFNKYILILTTILKVIYWYLIFVRKAIVKNYATNFNFNIKFNWFFNTTLAFVVIKELFFILFDKESLIYKQVIINSLQKQ